MKDKKLNYISLFSSAGIGCYGFKKNEFENILTAELLEERINIQRINGVSDDDGYIQGDISEKEIQNKIHNRIIKFNSDVDVIVATPPCQSVSTLNKKNAGDIVRNSLIVQSIQIVKDVKPKYFVFENVRSFLKALCIDADGETKTVRESIESNLGEEYLIRMDVINFKDYGTNSSRPRTLVIGTRKDLKNISPNHIWPDSKSGKTLREAIGHFEKLNKMGQFSKNDPWHFSRPFDERMLPWIKGLKQGESAFDNEDPMNRPHKIIDEKIIPHANKMTNKYKRMFWDKIAPCVHTRSDVLAAQYTIHPEQNRVLSISELKTLLNIPEEFKFIDASNKDVLSMGKEEMIKYVRSSELNIRRVIGEAVPYNIFESIAKNIKKANAIEEEFKKINLVEHESELKSFEAKGRFFELNNSEQESEGAYYTPQSVVFDIVDSISIDSKISGRRIKILEPSVGSGNFIPQLVKKFGEKNIELFLFDLNKKAIKNLKKNIDFFYPDLVVNYYTEDFILSNFNEEIDFVIGNPPYITLKKNKKDEYCEFLKKREESNNLITYFYLKSFKIAKRIYFVLPKYFLYSTEYRKIREYMNLKISKIFDYGVDYFDVFVETISILLEKEKQNEINVVNRKFTSLSRKIKSIDLMWEGIFIPYVNEEFIEHYHNTMERNFEMYRDRQITNSKLTDIKGGVRVIKSKNLIENEIINIKGYDKYYIGNASELNIYEKTFNSKNAYLVPNFTYKFRIVKKPIGTVTNGSIIVVIYNEKPNMEYLNSDKFRNIFLTIMSYSKFTLNLNKDIIKLIRW